MIQRKKFYQNNGNVNSFICLIKTSGWMIPPNILNEFDYEKSQLRHYLRNSNE